MRFPFLGVGLVVSAGLVFAAGCGEDKLESDQCVIHPIGCIPSFQIAFDPPFAESGTYQFVVNPGGSEIRCIATIPASGDTCWSIHSDGSVGGGRVDRDPENENVITSFTFDFPSDRSSVLFELLDADGRSGQLVLTAHEATPEPGPVGCQPILCPSAATITFEIPPASDPFQP